MPDIFSKFAMFSGIIVYLKIISIILALIFLVGIILLILKNSWLKYRFLENLTEFFIYRPFGVKKTFKEWAKINKRLEAGREADYKLAIIEADSLLNDILAKMGYGGGTITDRLKQIDSNILPNINQVWEVHKIRNNVVHDPDYQLSLSQATKVLSIYEESLRHLEMF